MGRRGGWDCEESRFVGKAIYFIDPFNMNMNSALWEGYYIK